MATTERLPTPEDEFEDAPHIDPTLVNPKPAPEPAQPAPKAEEPAPGPEKPAEAPSEPAEKPKRGWGGKRVRSLPPLPSEKPNFNPNDKGKPKDPEQEAKEREAAIRRLQAAHRRNLATAKRWGKMLQKLVDKGTTKSFGMLGVSGFEYDSEVLSKMGVDPTVITTIVPDGDSLEVVRLPVGEALAYHAASLGLKSFEGFIAWLYDHPVAMAVLGLTAVTVQHGMMVKEVADIIVQKMKEAQEAQRAAAVQAQYEATKGSQPVDTTPEVIKVRDEGTSSDV